MTVVASVLLVVTLFVLAGFLGNLASMNASDAAGNGLSYAFAMILGVAAWVLLAGLLLIAGLRGGAMPAWSVACAVVLHPLSCAAALACVELTRGRPSSELAWPVAVPAASAALLLAYAAWVYFPSLRTHVPPRVAGAIVWGGVLVLSVAPWPALATRRRADGARRREVQAAYAEQAAREAEARRLEELAAFEKLGPDAPLWRWLDFTSDGHPLRDRAFAAIRGLARRQSDAEEMIRRGYDLPVRELPHLALEPTPALGTALLDHLRKDAASFRGQAEGQVPYPAVAERIERHLPAMEWMAANGLDGAAVAESYAAAARAFPACAERDAFLSRLAAVGR